MIGTALTNNHYEVAQFNPDIFDGNTDPCWIKAMAITIIEDPLYISFE